MYGMPEGVYVTQVYDGTAAADAGMLNGDIIIGFEGSTVGSMEDLQGYLEYYEVGESVEVTIMRASGAHTLNHSFCCNGISLRIIRKKIIIYTEKSFILMLFIIINAWE